MNSGPVRLTRGPDSPARPKKFVEPTTELPTFAGFACKKRPGDPPPGLPPPPPTPTPPTPPPPGPKNPARIPPPFPPILPPVQGLDVCVIPGPLALVPAKVMANSVSRSDRVRRNDSFRTIASRLAFD